MKSDPVFWTLVMGTAFVVARIIWGHVRPLRKLTTQQREAQRYWDSVLHTTDSTGRKSWR